MRSSQQDAILSWIEGVSRSLQETSPSAERSKEVAGDPATSPSIPGSQHKRGRADWELGSLIPHPDPSKKVRRANSTSASLRSSFLRRGGDGQSLAPSSLAASRSGRPSLYSPSRVRAELQGATPKIIYLNEIEDPGSPAAEELLATLTKDAEFIGNERAMRNIYTTSCKHMTASAPESYWLVDVAVPLLKEAIGDLPLMHLIVYVC